MRTNTYLHCLLFIAAIGFSACEQRNSSQLSEAWTFENGPEKFEDFRGQTYKTKFAQLPLEGQLSKLPWSGDYWATYRGGISYRWNTTGGEKVFYDIPSKEDVEAMTMDELRSLSPAEKYDLYRGEYSFSTVTSERERTEVVTKDDIPGWEGLCHGWAPATIHFEDPAPVVMTNADGMKIPFGSSDVKAMLTYLEHDDMVVKGKGSRQVAGRCDHESYDSYLATVPEGMRDIFSEDQLKKFYIQSGCADENAGAFHIILTNQIGLLDEGFVIDVTANDEVWNQAVHSYQMDVVAEYTGDELLPTVGQGTKREVEINLILAYTTETAFSWELGGSYQLRSDDDRRALKYYRYRIELDENDSVIGGTWISEDRPDFATMRKRPEFNDYFAPLAEIYHKSVGLVVEPAPEPAHEPTPEPIPEPIDECDSPPTSFIDGQVLSLVHGRNNQYAARVLVDSTSVRKVIDGQLYQEKFFVRHSETDKSNIAFNYDPEIGAITGYRYNLSWNPNLLIKITASWQCDRFVGQFTNGSIIESLEIQ